MCVCAVPFWHRPGAVWCVKMLLQPFPGSSSVVAFVPLLAGWSKHKTSVVSRSLVDSLYSTTMYSTCVHPLVYLNRCKYKQPRQSVFFQWCVVKSHQKHDYDRVCSDFNGCLGSWSNHWSGRLYKATKGVPMPCLARCQPRQCGSGSKKPTEDLWAA